ncbi:hypothetical protein GSI_12735 [Ganoderma sinense ZZ0214-1]|uniref:Uncharacterized protein n=1 Tax=Ganoderma sinense ZZ0214-1 TaxID=1077348 RepID=A0A2G8RTM3_9APHY|nr:hypothetical protein GSI_12735 [Ganoderma sinense ZZ0214-1]
MSESDLDVEVIIPRPFGKVPRVYPNGDGRSLQELVGIEENLFKEIVVYISFFPSHLTLREYPILGQYEHGWPITTYLKLDLRLRRRSKKLSGETSHSKPIPVQEIVVDSQDNQDSELSPSRSSHTPGPITRVADRASVRVTVTGTPQKTKSTPVVLASPGSAPEKAPIALREKMRNRASQSTSLKSETSSRRDCVSTMCDSVTVQTASSVRPSTAVLGWIVSFDIPPADAQRITKLFASLGITDLAYLRAFARMESRDAWLREMRENAD